MELATCPRQESMPRTRRPGQGRSKSGFSLIDMHVPPGEVYAAVEAPKGEFCGSSPTAPTNPTSV